MSKISVPSQESIKWKFTTHIWCTYTTPKKSDLSRRLRVNHHVSNVSRFLFKKTFFSSSMFATYFSGWYGTIHWEKHWNSIATSGDGLLERKRYFQDGWQRQKFLSHAEKLLSVDVKPTVQDDASVKSINLDVQSYADTLEIAKIESIVFFSKQWTKLDIFFKKSTNNVIYNLFSIQNL